ncbi:DNA_photolyase domain-containing protein/FAD_binding_7 domain-containing protein [Cephalotus follicularis]|uniref:DNA_photolyase domain-containing protein/FAD_binding_7 domain-containing protein n=1 Tax=Cephalotus follicularis TaxID=3775 RepID=A0A1Q3BG04_CEPFO|nr:DNA_photolyase domain-containing protein/FAD_binding_7 domain-containing protein [Cephalotus follicularis]
MDPKIHNNPETSEPKEDPNQQNQPLAILAPSPFATVSLTLSLNTILPTHFFTQPKVSSLFPPPPPNKVKVPTQASSLSHLSLSTTISPSPSKISFKSTISSNPLSNPLSLGPRRPIDPSNGAAIRKASIVWFRNDLRVHDNETLNTANTESMSVLPVYCFDPRDYGKSSSGFDKTGPYRASFLIESVSDLRKNLQAKGTDLVVRIGNPETVLVELVKAIGADAVYAQREVSHDEVKAEEKIETAMKDEGVEVKYFWGSTLYHVDDLPFKVEDMPSNYGGFREKLQGLDIRKTIEALDQLKGMPSRGDVEPGEIPSLVDLGLNPNTAMAQDGKPAVNASMVGGETEALQRLKKFTADCQAQPPKGGSHDSIYGANFSCKISPWLAMGCISPRSMFDELKKTATRTISAGSKRDDGSSSDTGSNWLMFELMWRDFFRFVTKKYSSAKKLEGAPATACTGALA